MTSNVTRVMTAKALAFISVLLLSACDGGIFGTGGPDDHLMNSNAGVEGISDNSISQSEPGANASLETTTDGGTSGTASDTGGSATENNTVGTTDSASDAGFDSAGSIDAGTADAGAADAGTSDAGAINGVQSPGMPAVDAGGAGGGNTEPDAQVSVLNLSSITLNVASPEANRDIAVFELASVPAKRLSEDTAPVTVQTNLTISNSATAEELITFEQAVETTSSRSLLLVREDENGLISSLPLATETQTSDPGLAKVRIVQGGVLGDASIEAPLRLQSAGANPGGMDFTFEPLSFENPDSQYSELSAGDYELVDIADRFSPFAVSLTGGITYTLILTGDGSDTGAGFNKVLIVNDTQGTLLAP